MSKTETTKELWAKFAKSGLVSGAWADTPWDDLPQGYQEEFIELFGRKDEN